MTEASFTIEPGGATELGFATEPSFIRLSSALHPDCMETATTVFALNAKNYPFTLAEFEKTITLASSGTHVLHVRRIFADTKFALFVNGNYIGTGPVAAGGDYANTLPMPKQYFNSYDIPLEGNKLVILVRVHSPCVVMTDYSCGRSGFFFDAVTEDGTEIVSGGSWRVRRDCRYTGIGNADLTLPAPPWEMPEVIPAEECPWHLADPKMPMVVEEAIESATTETIEREADSVWFFAFPRIYSAYLLVHVESPVVGEIRISVGELSAPEENATERYRVPTGTTSIRSLRFYSIGAVRVVAPKGVAVSVSLSYVHYPVDRSLSGAFRCSDEKLNRIYEVGKFTLEMCRQSLHLDSPSHQETLGCTGDYAIEAAMTRMTFGDERITRLDLVRTADYLVMANGKMFHTTYSLIWVTMLLEYVQCADDKETLVYCLPALKILLDRFRSQIGDRGVIDSPTNCMFIDWGDLDGFSMHHPPLALGQTSLNAFWQGALNAAAKLYEITCDVGESARCVAEAVEHKAAFRAAFWDDDFDCFRDGFRKSEKDYEPDRWFAPNPEKTYHTRHCNALAVLFGLSDGDEAKSLMERVLTQESMDGTTRFMIQPYFMYYVIGAAIKVGLFSRYALDILHLWDGQIEKTDKGMREGWGEFNGDCSHAWGAAPTYYLPACVTGFKMIESAYRKFSLSPNLLGLEWAEASIPTPYGMISVKIDRNGREIKVPEAYIEIESLVYVRR